MPRRLLVRLRRRLEASFLPLADPLRLELEAELLDLMTPTIRTRPPSFVVFVHDDAHGAADTTLPD